MEKCTRRVFGVGREEIEIEKRWQDAFARKDCISKHLRCQEIGIRNLGIRRAAECFWGSEKKASKFSARAKRKEPR